MATILLRLPQVRQMCGLSRSEIYRRMGLGEFPKNFSLGGARARAVCWNSEEIENWIADRIKESRTAESDKQRAHATTTAVQSV
ncbi:AlpA family phage regulatory protein [Ferrovum sp.]|uniref:helix-turn-helix transcriptional regulator n=1 Tax=Ferrovum sp. TaxID=2609467 RepID=UPI002630B35B|nr:AlpA family phage regulatory protein [Ferrovum sp.]